MNSSKFIFWIKFKLIWIFFFPLFNPVHMKLLKEVYGVLQAESSSGEKVTECIVYFKDLGNVASKESSAESYIFEDNSQIDWCEDQPGIDPQNKVIFKTPNNICSIFNEALNIQDRNGKGMLYIIDNDNLRKDYNESDASGVNITVGYVGIEPHKILMKMDKPVRVKMFSPGEPGFEYSLIVIWFIAIFTICTGSYLSKGARYQVMQQARARNSAAKETEQTTVTDVGVIRKVSILDDQSINVAPIYVFILVVFMSGMLLLVYFFFSYLVYFMIGMFTLASIGAIYFCLEPLVEKIPLNIWKFHVCGCEWDIRKILLFATALGVSTFWVVVRNEEYAWILQDILAIFFSVHILKTIRLGNLKMCTYILCFLFFYDIFFVFVTPYFTKKGISIMEEVARGGSTSKEMVPMVIKIVHLAYDPMSACFIEFSILGLGDILLPGLLVSYCLWYDAFTPKRKLYFWVSIIGYGVGMIFTYLGLFLMEKAQPALLYLVPCCLLPVVILACIQGELKALWTGILYVDANSTNSHGQVVITDPVPEVVSTTEPSMGNNNYVDVPKAIEISQDENNYLLK